jgi:predicted glycosyltransferase
MLDLLAFARLYIGEGGSMAAEAAVLGVPAVFCNRLRVGYLVALEKQWGLAVNVDRLEQGLPRALELLAQDDLKNQWQQRRQIMLSQSDDVAGFMVRLITQVAQGTFSSGR